MAKEITFPRQHSRTQRFTLGAPRSFTPSPDGRRVVFLRSRGGAERANLLHLLDLSNIDAPFERVVADPVALLGGGEEKLSAEERARRERSREGSAGIIGYAVDAAVTRAVFALSGRLFLARLTEPGEESPVVELPSAGTVLDPRLSPDGSLVAYATAEGELRVVAADAAGAAGTAGAAGAGAADRAVALPDGPQVTWGQAEFIAQEEMDRTRGFWWSPDGRALLAARVDESPVPRWWIADPANPDQPPAEVAYPRAGAANADVRLAVLGTDGTDGTHGTHGTDAARVDVEWDREAYPYLARASWPRHGRPLLLVQSRDQRRQQYLEADPETGATTPLLTEEDPAWNELFPGSPARTDDGRLVRVADLPGLGGTADGVRAVVVDGVPWTGPELHVRALLDVGPDDVLFAASAGEAVDEPGIGQVHVYRADASGVRRVSREPGLHTAVRAGDLLVLSSATLDRSGAVVRVLRDDPAAAEPVQAAVVESHAEAPVLTARPVLTLAGKRRIPAAVLLPTGYDRDRDGLLPVLMNPYGGPHGQMVLAAQNAHLVSQWFADQGFAVVVADGRGTPGRSPAWEKSIAFDMADTSLADQVEALQALAQDFPLDLDRVGIRGWSYGGYLAALAVLRRPDVFHAAVAGAPVTDFALYDTHYTERYLGLPQERPEVYARHALTGDAAGLRRPLQIIHGLADDNVVVAHSLRLSSALLAAGRPHQVLPLSGVTHMTPQEEVAENLLLLQVGFLKRELGR